MRTCQKRAVLCTIVMVRQSDTVGSLDAENKVVREGGRIVRNNRALGQDNRVTRKEGPEPLIDLDGRIMVAVLVEVIDRAVFRVDKPPPGIVVPPTGPDMQQICSAHTVHYLSTGLQENRLPRGIHVPIRISVELPFDPGILYPE